MKVTYAPLVSGASGRFAGLVASSWKGVDLVRRFRAPSNPNTTAQVNVRRAFLNLNRAYATMSAEIRAAWQAFAVGRPLIGRNHWIGLNVAVIAGDANLDDLVGTPGDASTLGPDAMVVTPGANTLTVDITEPTVPAGWTLQAAVATVLQDRDPTTILTFAELLFTEGEDVATPFSIVLAGLTSAVPYQVIGFLRWLHPDGGVRYSSALRDQGTPT